MSNSKRASLLAHLVQERVVSMDIVIIVRQKSSGSIFGPTPYLQCADDILNLGSGPFPV
jgi:hypothetical protein